TGGSTQSCTGTHEWNVSKCLLIASLQSALQGGRLKISSRLPLADVVRKELLNYRVKLSKSANELYEAKDSEHDDCVISLALPIPVASQRWGQAMLPGLVSDAVLDARIGRVVEEDRATAMARRQAEFEADIDNPHWWS